MKSVYSAVRTGSLNKAVCAWSAKGYIKRVIIFFAPEDQTRRPLAVTVRVSVQTVTKKSHIPLFYAELGYVLRRRFFPTTARRHFNELCSSTK
jgi:hypothetical protein